MDKTQDIEQRHQKFIETICESEVVFALENGEEFATSQSESYEDEEGEPSGLICFWSNEALAKSSINEDWADFTVSTIPLAEFIENWCVGMHYDNLVVGTEFDENMFGHEVEPLLLILEISAQLTRMEKTVKLRKFEGIEDLTQQVKALLEEE